MNLRFEVSHMLRMLLPSVYSTTATKIHQQGKTNRARMKIKLLRSYESIHHRETRLVFIAFPRNFLAGHSSLRPHNFEYSNFPARRVTHRAIKIANEGRQFSRRVSSSHPRSIQRSWIKHKVDRDQSNLNANVRYEETATTVGTCTLNFSKTYPQTFVQTVFAIYCARFLFRCC